MVVARTLAICEPFNLNREALRSKECVASGGECNLLRTGFCIVTPC